MRKTVKNRIWPSTSALGLAVILLSIPYFSACSASTAAVLPEPAVDAQQMEVPEETAAPSQEPEEEIPELPLTGNYTLTSGTAYGVATKFPDTWELTEPATGVQAFTITRKNPEPGNGDNFNIIVSQKRGRDLLPSDLPDFKEGYSSQVAMYGLDASNMRMVSIGGIPSFYYDYYAEMTDEAIDFAVENGIFTQEIVDYYGKDTLKDMLQCYQVVGVASVDGTIIIVTGTYYDEADKTEMVDIVNLLISNAKVVS